MASVFFPPDEGTNLGNYISKLISMINNLIFLRISRMSEAATQLLVVFCGFVAAHCSDVLT